MIEFLDSWTVGRYRCTSGHDFTHSDPDGYGLGNPTDADCPTCAAVVGVPPVTDPYFDELGLS